MQLAIGFAEAPWGSVFVAATGRGVTAMENLVSRDEFLARLDRRFGSIEVVERGPAPLQLERALRALQGFIDGDLDALDPLPVDLEDRTAFDREVFTAVRGIPPGSTASYGEVARMVGRPGAARAVGGAVGRCPIGLVVPCHRVIAGDGTLGGYGGGWWGGRQAGLELKSELLAREGVHLRRSVGSG